MLTHCAVAGHALQRNRRGNLLTNTNESGNRDNLRSQELCLAVGTICHLFGHLDNPLVRASILAFAPTENQSTRGATQLGWKVSHVGLPGFGPRACFHRCALASWR